MGEDPGSTDAGRRGEAGLREGGAIARSAAGSEGEAGQLGTNGDIGPLILDQRALERWGEEIGRHAARPLVLALRGELGSGKSVLARAVARGAGVTSAMPSPTFNLVFRYDLERHTVWHIDLYRLEREGDVWELGWRELGSGNDVVLIEWPERAERWMPSDRWDVRLTAGPAETLRTVTATRKGGAQPLPAPAE